MGAGVHRHLALLLGGKESDRQVTTWKPVVGYEGVYEVSDAGSVRNTKGRELSPKRRGDYFAVELYQNGSGKFFSIHTLVLTAFIGPRPEASEACHNNGNPLDNRLSNLRWGSKFDNAKDRLRHGTVPNRDRGHYKAILTSAQVEQVKRDGRVARVIAIELGVSKSLIDNIRSGYIDRMKASFK